MRPLSRSGLRSLSPASPRALTSALTASRPRPAASPRAGRSGPRDAHGPGAGGPSWAWLSSSQRTGSLSPRPSHPWTLTRDGPYNFARPLRSRNPGRFRFQSPTSRGDLCNEEWSKVQGEFNQRFNPLPHGATSATGRRRSATPPSRWLFQSPTSRGDLCNWPASGLRWLRGPVSIPYLTGRPLQHLCLHRALEDAVRFQSPTSRGDLCNWPPVAIDHW